MTSRPQTRKRSRTSSELDRLDRPEKLGKLKQVPKKTPEKTPRKTPEKTPKKKAAKQLRAVTTRILRDHDADFSVNEGMWVKKVKPLTLRDSKGEVVLRVNVKRDLSSVKVTYQALNQMNSSLFPLPKFYDRGTNGKGQEVMFTVVPRLSEDDSLLNPHHYATERKGLEVILNVMIGLYHQKVAGIKAKFMPEAIRVIDLADSEPYLLELRGELGERLFKLEKARVEFVDLCFDEKEVGSVKAIDSFKVFVAALVNQAPYLAPLVKLMQGKSVGRKRQHLVKGVKLQTVLFCSTVFSRVMYGTYVVCNLRRKREKEREKEKKGGKEGKKEGKKE